MTRVFDHVIAVIAGRGPANRIVPPSGATVWPTVLAAGAMAFLAVFALSVALATDRLADRWADSLAHSATVRVTVAPDQADQAVDSVLRILAQTPGIAEARALDQQEISQLLAPWLGAELPLEDLPLPRLIEIRETDAGFDAESLRLRLSAEVPGAELDDHARWRRPLVLAAGRIRALGMVSLGLIVAAMAAMVTLAARAALAANRQVIEVLRLVGARDAYIARAFVRRFTHRAGTGALVGTLVGMSAIALLPGPAQEGAGFLSGLGFRGAEWLLPLVIPVVAAIVAFAATRAAARGALREVQ
ncbi:cell division transport system permease protein [Albidovulum inexpectatum]|uniref:Cell division transport system permease protein n=1 Tax=Albidovulum inexpectatum TaxID=196587 RepID=A0A2S5JGI5_9RHOB|nr:FtsX-like permease family protein [Albidovulum inexpectatum]PPB80540.1 cell division transport system permease protein [Albidovulum inexpectatum]